LTDLSSHQLEATVRGTLTDWWGADVQAWKLLKIYRIPYAQPAQRPPYTVNQAAKVRWIR